MLKPLPEPLYKIIRTPWAKNGPNYAEFESCLNKYLRTGWKLYGNPMNQRGYISQAIIREDFNGCCN